MSVKNLFERLRGELLLDGRIKTAMGYLIITWIFGGLIAVFDRNPSRPDWDAHWNRVLQILAGHPVSEPDPSGSEAYGAIIENNTQLAFNNGIGRNSTIGDFVPFSNTAINSPYTYWPSLLSDGHYVRAGVITLVCCSIMIAVAIYLAGQWRHMLLAVALLPTTLLSMTFPTSDAVSNATALLFIGMVLYGWQKDSLSWRYIIALTVMAVALGQSKVTFNLLIILLVPLIFGKRLIGAAIPFVASPISYYCWSRMITQAPPSGATSVAEYHNGIREYITHPWNLITTDFFSFVSPIDMTGDDHDLRRNIQLVTGSEGNTLLPLGVMLPMLFAFVLLIIMDKPASGWLYRSSVLVTLVLFYTATTAALVLSFSGVRPGSVAVGLQSRYFIVALPLLALLIPSIGIEITNRKAAKTLTYGCILWAYIGLILAHLLVWPVH